MTLSFTVDGREITAKPGQTVLEASNEAGIYIPHLCAHKDLVPHGSCRVCSVRCNGRIQAACVQTVSEGMVVESETAELREYRAAILDMLFVDGNHFCMFCEKSGFCELQALAYRFGITAPQFPRLCPAREVDLSPREVYLDHNRCILCGRCMRMAESLEEGGFAFVERGHKKRLRVDRVLLDEMSAEALGSIVSACPVGALMRKRSAYAVPIGERPFDIEPIGGPTSTDQKKKPEI